MWISTSFRQNFWVIIKRSVMIPELRDRIDSPSLCMLMWTEVVLLPGNLCNGRQQAQWPQAVCTIVLTKCARSCYLVLHKLVFVKSIIPSCAFIHEGMDGPTAILHKPRYWASYCKCSDIVDAISKKTELQASICERRRAPIYMTIRNLILHHSLTPQIPLPPLTPSQSPFSLLLRLLRGAQLMFPTS